MIAKILIALSIVIGFFMIPSFVNSHYTEKWDLLQDGCQSFIIIMMMCWAVRGYAGIAIGVIEAFLIAIALKYGLNFEQRHTLYVAIHYNQINVAAFIVELAIIGARAITGLREIGADYRSYVASYTARTFNTGNRERHQ